MKVSRKYLNKIIQEEWRAVIGEGRFGDLSVEIHDELRMLMTKFNIDIGGLRGILSDMEASPLQEGEFSDIFDQENAERADASRWKPDRGQEGGGEENPGYDTHYKGDDDELSMSETIVSSIMQALTSDTVLDEQGMADLQQNVEGIVSSAILPLYNHVQTIGLDDPNN